MCQCHVPVIVNDAIVNIVIYLKTAVMDRKFHTRLVSLVTVLACVSMISVMITDLHFYRGKIRDQRKQEAVYSLPLVAGNENLCHHQLYSQCHNLRY